MYCLKCGSDVKLPNVFCDPCLEKMESAPVPSDAIVHIPERPVLAVEKKTRKKKRTDAQRIHALRRWSIFQSLVILALCAVICLLAYQTLLSQNNAAKPQQPPKGQNFSTQQTTTAPAETTEIPSAT